MAMLLIYELLVTNYLTIIPHKTRCPSMRLGKTASVPNISGMDIPKDIKDQGVHTDDPLNSKFFLKDLYRAVSLYIHWEPFGGLCR